MNILFSVSLIFILTSILGFVLRYLKQPLFLAYLITGVILGPGLINTQILQSNNQLLMQLSLSFLLFFSALFFRLELVKELGKGVVAGMAIFLTLFLIVFAFLFQILKIEMSVALLLSLSLAFSSWFLPIKTISDDNDTHNLHGKLTTVFLMAQAGISLILACIFTGYTQTENSFGLNLIQTVIKLSLVLVNSFLIFRYILPRFYSLIFKSTEFSIIFSLSWALIMASIFDYIGLPFELGAMVGGFFLSETKFADELIKKLTVFRNLILIVFALSLGGLVSWGQVGEKIPLIVFLTFLSLIIKPVLSMLLWSFYPFSKRTSLISSYSYAGTGEISLIFLLMLGVSGAQDYASVIVATLILSLILHSYLNANYLSITNWLEQTFPSLKEIKFYYDKNLVQGYEVILLGCGKLGENYLRLTDASKDQILIVDSNLEKVENLQNRGYRAVFADVEEPEVVEQIKFKKTKLVFSTIRDTKTNIQILTKLKKIRYAGVKIVVSENLEETLSLYSKGASLVLLPHYMNYEEPAKLVSKLGYDEEKYLQEQNFHFNRYFK